MYIHTLVDQERWDLACDIAAEAVINELDIRSVKTKRSAGQDAVIKNIKEKTKFLTAERIYHYLISNSIDRSTEEKWTEMFRQDDHFIWYLNDKQKQQVTGVSGSESGESGIDGSGSARGDSDGGTENQNQNSTSQNAKSREQLWKSISERIQQDLETFSKDRGDSASNLVQNLSALNRERYDYTSFLKKFAVLGEKMQINDDEFDFVFYTYGLNLYGNVPLIEPLEYKEVKSIREFVIAIDTSGSVSGPQVQAFLNKTYNIMKSTESFFSRINVHIIQCDAAIQEDAKITNQEEFDQYINKMQLRGFGGTDFRPVFSFVDKLIREHEFSNLKGLIYFTDGYGVFPEKKPDYETAFVFIRDDFIIPDVPPWAIKLVLEPEELRPEEKGR
jgi:predicted metal-dependent peptidase